MADFDEALVDHLLNQPSIAALVEKRIFPDYFPQDEQPRAIAYTLEDDSSQQTQQGPSGMREAIYLINIWADTRREVMAVTREVQSALDGYKGAFKDIPVLGATKASFAAYVANIQPTAPVGSALELNVTLLITGPVTWS